MLFDPAIHSLALLGLLLSAQTLQRAAQAPTFIFLLSSAQFHIPLSAAQLRILETNANLLFQNPDATHHPTNRQPLLSIPMPQTILPTNLLSSGSRCYYPPSYQLTSSLQIPMILTFLPTNLNLKFPDETNHPTNEPHLTNLQHPDATDCPAT